jgi:hypothetical protein
LGEGRGVRDGVVDQHAPGHNSAPCEMATVRALLEPSATMRRAQRSDGRVFLAGASAGP